MKHIEIAKVLQLTKEHKYEAACASFDLVDHIVKVDLPRGLKGRKKSVQAMTLLADKLINYDYDLTGVSQVAVDKKPEEKKDSETKEEE